MYNEAITYNGMEIIQRNERLKVANFGWTTHSPFAKWLRHGILVPVFVGSSPTGVAWVVTQPKILTEMGERRVSRVKSRFFETEPGTKTNSPPAVGHMGI